MKNKIATLQSEFAHDLKSAQTEPALEDVRVRYLSRKGSIANLMASLKDCSLEEKKIIGPLLNSLKNECETQFQERSETIKNDAISKQDAKKKHFDVTAHIPYEARGSLHPLTQFQDYINNIFLSMGFEILDGPEVETEFYNFEALNIAKNHPARDMFDTLWLDVPGLLLRTHTSPVQIHGLEKSVPLAAVAPGRCYRHEATDASHDFSFMQVEAIMVDEGVSMAHLLGTINQFINALFETKSIKTRIRNSFFPFVEPGIEIDVECPFCTQGCSVCKRSRWIELGGAGLIHPNVLKACNVDVNRYSGFAFGFGLTRLAMLKYGIPDVRFLHNNTIEFLKQF